MAPLNFLCFSFLLAGAFASPVASVKGQDLHFDIPDINDETFQGFKVSIHNGTVDAKNFNVKLVKPGLAEASVDVLDGEILKYKVSGWVGALDIHGEGLISLQLYPAINVSYVASPAGSNCALANSTKYTVRISKIKAKITGLKMDLTDISGLAEKYLEGHPDKIAQTLEENMNDSALHPYVDPWTVKEIDAVCSKGVTPPTNPVDQLLGAILMDAIRGILTGNN